MLAIVFAVVLGGGLLWVAAQSREARLRVVEEAFRALKADPVRTSRGVQGRVKGLVLRFGSDVRRRPEGLGQTWCRVALPAVLTPFEMDLRPETRLEAIDVERGRAIDLTLGDRAFDESFVVEAAPAETVRALLDEPARTGLLAFHPCRMTVEEGELRFRKQGRLDELAEIKRVLELCSHVAARLQALPAEFHEQRLMQAQGGQLAGYRGPTPEAIRALATAPDAAAELAELHRVRGRRTRVRALQSLAIVIAGIMTWLWMLSHVTRR